MHTFPTRRGMRMTIYVPDDLAAMVKEHDDLNISAVCQEALRVELSRREASAKLGEGMKRHVVYIERRGSVDLDGGIEVGFVGKEVDDDGRNRTAYITRRGRIAIYNHDEQSLYEFDSFADLVRDEVWELSYPVMVSSIAEALGEKHVIELDI
jgi:post-segregation antitoxin (ccd killing protein)